MKLAQRRKSKSLPESSFFLAMLTAPQYCGYLAASSMASSVTIPRPQSSSSLARRKTRSAWLIGLLPLATAGRLSFRRNTTATSVLILALAPGGSVRTLKRCITASSWAHSCSEISLLGSLPRTHSTLELVSFLSPEAVLVRASPRSPALAGVRSWRALRSCSCSWTALMSWSPA